MAHCNLSHLDDARVAIHLTRDLFLFLNHKAVPLATHKHTSIPLRQRRICPQAHLSRDTKVHTATPHPLLIANGFMRQTGLMLAAAATFTRKAEATVLRNLWMGTLLDTKI